MVCRTLKSRVCAPLQLVPVLRRVSGRIALITLHITSRGEALQLQPNTALEVLHPVPADEYPPVTGKVQSQFALAPGDDFEYAIEVDDRVPVDPVKPVRIELILKIG